MTSRQGEGTSRGDSITRETTSRVEPTAGRTRASHSRDPALSTETGGTTTTTAESAESRPQTTPTKEQKVTLNWRDGGKAPFEMCRGAAVVDGGVAYFMDWDGQACSYNSTNKKWSELPKYPYRYGSLAVVNGQLTAIGGCDVTFTSTNKLLTLRESWLRRSWSDVFPPMPTKRRGTTAVTSKEHLIVAGGSTGLDLLIISTQWK